MCFLPFCVCYARDQLVCLSFRTSVLAYCLIYSNSNTYWIHWLASDPSVVFFHLHAFIRAYVYMDLKELMIEYTLSTRPPIDKKQKM